MEHARHLRLASRPLDPTTDAALVAGLRACSPGVRAAVVRQYGGLVRTILLRLLGASDQDRADLLQDVFLRVFEGIDQLSRPEAFKAWVSRIAVFVAREHIRKARRRRWIAFLGDDQPEAPAPAVPGEGVREAVRCLYAVLGRMPVDERLVLSLHAWHGMELDEIAPLCALSYATARRRLRSARKRFSKMARNYEALAPWLES